MYLVPMSIHEACMGGITVNHGI